jgi:hypothetical protein
MKIAVIGRHPFWCFTLRGRELRWEYSPFSDWESFGSAKVSYEFEWKARKRLFVRGVGACHDLKFAVSQRALPIYETRGNGFKGILSAWRRLRPERRTDIPIQHRFSLWPCINKLTPQGYGSAAEGNLNLGGGLPCGCCAPFRCPFAGRFENPPDSLVVVVPKRCDPTFDCRDQYGSGKTSLLMEIQDNSGLPLFSKALMCQVGRSNDQAYQVLPVDEVDLRVVDTMLRAFGECCGTYW